MSSLHHSFVKLDMIKQVARIRWTHDDANHTAIRLKISESASLVSSNPGVSTRTRRLGFPDSPSERLKVKGWSCAVHDLRS